MIFFPPLFPDELLYSAFARYHQNSGNENHKETTKELFGNSSVCASILFPSHISNLSLRMPLGSPYISKDFIQKYSIIPYFGPFIPTKRLLKIKKVMELGKSSPVNMLLGRTASTISPMQNLQYCPNCVKEDREKYGEAYWHRSHQVEGVYLCHMHDSTLLKSRVALSKQRNKHKFVPLEHALSNSAIPINLPVGDLGHLQFIAKQTNILLNTEYPSFGLKEINRFYVSRLQHMDLANHTGRIRWADLIPAFNRFYGVQFLMNLQCYIEFDQDATWLHKLLRKPRVTCHPLRHILVIGFLNQTIESMASIITSRKTNYEPFGQGPWPCLNKAANHYRMSVVSLCEITRCSKTGLPVGTFSCQCGYVYSRKGPDHSDEDQFKIGRVKCFGEVWEERFQTVSKIDMPLREKARLLGCDPKTVLNRISISKVVINTIDIQENVHYKEKWIRLIADNSESSISELRGLNQSVFSWLYRREREWLQEHSPPKIKVTMNQGRINWEGRDQQTAEEVRLSAIEILNETSERLIRVTKTEIGRRMGKLPLLFKSLHKLPQTANQLNTVLETMEDFQERRINIKAAELRNTSAVVKRWELIRASGLRETFIDNHRDIIDKHIH